jgi:hypothetical protein
MKKTLGKNKLGRQPWPKTRLGENLGKKNKGEITLYPPEVSTNFHFCLQSLKCDTLPPQTFKLWQFNPFGLFIPKMPPTLFFSKKKNSKKKTQKNI